MTSPIYLDHNAATPLLPAARVAMLDCLEMVGNPASSHRFGRRARQHLENAREQVAFLLDAFPDEVIFTSGATEANNLALFGLGGESPALVIGSRIEHSSVSEPLAQLARLGFTIDWLAADANGVVDLSKSQLLFTADPSLATLQLANHETGALQPVSELVESLPPSVPVHCDAVQAVGKIPVRFHELGSSSLSLSAHKFHGPGGIGALLLRRGRKLRPRQFGGHQQAGQRPGTESVALAVGLAAALNAAVCEHAQRNIHLLALRQYFLNHLLTHAQPCVLNGPAEGGLAHTINLSFPGLRGDALLMALDLEGIACATGSACSSGSLLPSPVLQAMGVPDDVLRSALRFSMGFDQTMTEIEDAARRICMVVSRLRRK